MKRSVKKIATLLVTSIMIVGVLGGCGNETAETPNNTETETQSTAGVETPNATTASYDEMVAFLKNRVILKKV